MKSNVQFLGVCQVKGRQGEWALLKSTTIGLLHVQAEMVVLVPCDSAHSCRLSPHPGCSPYHSRVVCKLEEVEA